ncbi:hypothetical protein COB52_05075 [Candidatus Kaiserbacteria bacterium]|nr:MAG: hypothetical protein COB52_05075 [Candidatus Kaiserbacteria bacterium]
MQGIESCIVLSQHLAPQKISTYLIPYIRKYAEDKSWRIRYLVADKIMEISQGVGFELAKEHLLGFYCSFLVDNESEVRTAAVSRIAEFAGVLDTQTIV